MCRVHRRLATSAVDGWDVLAVYTPNTARLATVITLTAATDAAQRPTAAIDTRSDRATSGTGQTARLLATIDQLDQTVTGNGK